jgi:type II secretory pathway component PulF
LTDGDCMQFVYKVSDSRGRITQGSETADSREQLIAKLKAEGKYLLEIKSVGKLAKPYRGKTISQQDRLVFTQQLAGLLAAGISIERALTILSRLVSGAQLTGLVNELNRFLQEGHSFSAALENFPRFFPPIYVSMVRAGEAGGVLPEVLHQLAKYQEDEVALKRFLVSSLTYPAIVVGASILAVIYFVGEVIPKFQEIFDDIGGEMPAITKSVMMVGRAFRDGWWIGAAFIVFGVIWLGKELATVEGRLRVDRFKLKLPLIGDLICKTAVAKMTLCLSLLVHSGVSLLAGIRITADIMNNAVLTRALREVENDVKTGHSLTKSMKAQKVFPVMAVEMIGVGEESGNLHEMLGRVAKTYENEVKNTLGIFLSLFEPMLILGMVGIIAVLAVAILLPVVNLNSQL